MNRLRELIRNREIHAVYVYHPDRLPSKPAHRLIFRALCEENGVLVRCRYGQIPDGEMGEVLEFLDSWAKEKQVSRAQQGSKDGLRDRARIKGLPVNGKVPYGYKLHYELVREGNNIKQVPVAYEPDPIHYPVACRIWREAAEGLATRRICTGLMRDGIPSPKGNANWVPATIYGILKNPLYGGKYYALRREVRAPLKDPDRPRKRPHSASTRKELNEAILLDFSIVSPAVTWPEWEAVQKRLMLNKAQSKRNSGQLYLLSQMLYCGRDGRRLQPYWPKGKSHYYSCSLRRGNALGVESCTLRQLNGEEVETQVWNSIVEFLSNPVVFMAEMERRQTGVNHDREQVVAIVNDLRTKVDKLIKAEADLAIDRYRPDNDSKLSDEAYHRAGALLRAERVHYEEEIERQKLVLDTRDTQAKALESLIVARDRMAHKLSDVSVEEKRWVLQNLERHIKAYPDRLEVSIGVPNHIADSVHHTRVLRLAVLT